MQQELKKVDVKKTEKS